MSRSRPGPAVRRPPSRSGGAVGRCRPARRAPAQASRTVAESYPVPATGRSALTGHGYGHGHGMSQYGAQGAAQAGAHLPADPRLLLPGHDLGHGAGQIRVLISADTDHDVARGPAERACGCATWRAGRRTPLPRRAGSRPGGCAPSAGRTVLDYYDGSLAHRAPRRHGARRRPEFYRAGHAHPARRAATTRPTAARMRLSSGDTVNVLGMDDYVKGVVPREMPASWLPGRACRRRPSPRAPTAPTTAAPTPRGLPDLRHHVLPGLRRRGRSRTRAATRPWTPRPDQVLTYAGSPPSPSSAPAAAAGPRPAACPT